MLSDSRGNRIINEKEFFKGGGYFVLESKKCKKLVDVASVGARYLYASTVITIGREGDVSAETVMTAIPLCKWRLCHKATDEERNLFVNYFYAHAEKELYRRFRAEVKPVLGLPEKFFSPTYKLFIHQPKMKGTSIVNYDKE